MKKVLVLLFMAGTMLYACQQSTKTETESETATEATTETPAVEESAPADSLTVTDSAGVEADSVQ